MEGEAGESPERAARCEERTDAALLCALPLRGLWVQGEGDEQEEGTGV